jgi:SulP family sulfate permease
MRGVSVKWPTWLLSLPAAQWSQGYNRQTFSEDALAAVIVTIMLIPQSLAYATLAGLPAQAGLYASILPLVLYALLGTSRVLAVGPVAVVSLMTASTIGQLAEPLSQHYAVLAITLAFLSGAMLLLMGALRLGFVANFLSHPVISGFITASALLIALGQLHVLLGLKAQGAHFVNQLAGLAQQITKLHGLTAAVGLGTLAFLFCVRRSLKPILIKMGLSVRYADVLSKAAPIAVIALTAALAWWGAWQGQGLRIVGTVPQGLPPLTWPSLDVSLLQELLLPALLISVVGFVESVSVGQTLAARRRQRIEPNQELIALGASNVGAALTAGFPVTGGFARSVVNFDAGARTPAAGIMTAAGIMLAALLLTPALYYVPQAVLSATIIVAVMSLVDVDTLARTWRYSKLDFSAALATIAATLLWGVEAGLVAGVALSLAFFLYRTSRPHIAQVGLVPGTEYFRNVQRHAVLTSDRVLVLRVDESLYFANARALEDRINDEVASRPQLQHVVLQCSAVNSIDASALESLEAIDQRLAQSSITLHLSEVKGPVMDQLGGTDFVKHLRGGIYLTQFQAAQALTPELIGR